jgi:flagellar protein FlaG
MVSVVISEGLILVTAIIIAAGFSVTILNQMGVFKSTIVTAGATEKEIALTKIKVLYATNSSSTEVKIWVKNVGSNPVVGLDKSDVYFGKLSYVERIPYNHTSSPTWVYANGTGTQWHPKDTLEFNVTSDDTLESSVTYVVRVATPNGVSDDYIFSVP